MIDLAVSILITLGAISVPLLLLELWDSWWYIKLRYRREQIDS